MYLFVFSVFCVQKYKPTFPNRLMIRPNGVTSKKDMGDRRMLVSMDSCNIRLAITIPNAIKIEAAQTENAEMLHVFKKLINFNSTLSKAQQCINS